MGVWVSSTRETFLAPTAKRREVGFDGKGKENHDETDLHAASAVIHIGRAGFERERLIGLGIENQDYTCRTYAMLPPAAYYQLVFYLQVVESTATDRGAVAPRDRKTSKTKGFLPVARRRREGQNQGLPGITNRPLTNRRSFSRNSNDSLSDCSSTRRKIRDE